MLLEQAPEILRRPRRLSTVRRARDGGHVHAKGIAYIFDALSTPMTAMSPLALAMPTLREMQLPELAALRTILYSGRRLSWPDARASANVRSTIATESSGLASSTKMISNLPA